jgi:uncharacterized protein
MTDPIAHTQAWFEKAVIGLNLCPFAKAVHQKGQIRWVLADATTPQALLELLAFEMAHLHATPAHTTDTTVVVHPQVLQDFADYNDFLDEADAALLAMELDGVLQVASFHPQYQFADADAGDVSNCTNRSPYPTLHLLRESSVERAVKAFPDADSIVENNIQTLEQLGMAGWLALMQR